MELGVRWSAQLHVKFESPTRIVKLTAVTMSGAHGRSQCDVMPKKNCTGQGVVACRGRAAAMVAAVAFGVVGGQVRESPQAWTRITPEVR